MKIGTIFLGEVEEIQGHHIATKFLIIGLPLLPLASFYATSATFSGINGFEIPLHGPSVALGYARTGLFAMTLVFGAWAFFEEKPFLYLFAGIALVAWVVCLFFLGKLSKLETLKRMILKSHTGIYADPMMLSQEMRSQIYESLEADWQALVTDKPWLLNNTPWKQCLTPSPLDLDHYTLAYTMARYANNIEAAEMVWVFVDYQLGQRFQAPSSKAV